jgi:hypothetical protein
MFSQRKLDSPTPRYAGAPSYCWGSAAQQGQAFNLIITEVTSCLINLSPSFGGKKWAVRAEFTN